VTAGIKASNSIQSDANHLRVLGLGRQATKGYNRAEWNKSGKVCQKDLRMSWQRGERQTQRTKQAVEAAFLQLLQEKSYPAITVDELVSRANVGRSTFYRHFQSKPDVLLSLHEALFQRIGQSLTTAADWLAPTPSPSLIAFLEHLQQYDQRDASWPLWLGKDADYLIRRIDELLVQQLEASLRRCFAEAECALPLAVLAQAVAGSYSRIIRWWFDSHCTLPASQTAHHLHHLVRALVRAALTHPQP
jgi:AcrR family transcriptional regulator